MLLFQISWQTSVFSFLPYLIALFVITVLLSHYRSHVFLASDLLLQAFLYAVLSSTHLDLDAFHDTHCCKVVWCSTPMADFPVSPLELYPELSPVSSAPDKLVYVVH